MRRVRILGLGIILALFIGGFHEWSPARAAVSHVFGDGGKVYQFDAQCHRVTFAPPGISNGEAINILGQQVHCLVRRPDPFARCVKKLGPAPEVHVVAKDDWVGVDDLQAYVAAIGACSTARY